MNTGEKKTSIFLLTKMKNTERGANWAKGLWAGRK
jgi:hypothetical protein